MSKYMTHCSECGKPVPIAGPDDMSAGVMCLECATPRDYYMEALAIIMNPNSLMLPERAHLVAMYKHVYELEQIVKESVEHVVK